MKSSSPSTRLRCTSRTLCRSPKGAAEVRHAPIALFVPSLHGGGAERVILDIAAELVNRAIPVHLVLVSAEGHYRDLVPEGVRLINLNSHRTAASLLKLVGYIRQERPAALLSTLAHANVIALVAKLILRGRLRVVTRIANTYSEELATGSFKHRLALRLLKLLLPTADCIVAVSQGVADDLINLGPAISRRITTIYNPVVRSEMFEQASAPVKHRWFQDESIPMVLSAGRLTTVKDHSTLLRAFAEVVRSRPARLVILGEGPERENLLGLSEQLGISQQVDLPGFEVNPFAYMARSRVFVLSSRYEGFPNVLVQAMACGTSVVSTECRSGPSEILGGGKWGRLVPVGDWNTMSEAILETLDNPIPSDRLISRASCFSAEASVDRYLEVLTGS